MDAPYSERSTNLLKTYPKFDPPLLNLFLQYNADFVHNDGDTKVILASAICGHVENIYDKLKSNANSAFEILYYFTDLANRRFQDTSVLQYVFWSLDIPMFKMIIERLPSTSNSRETVKQQIRSLLLSTNNHGAHFSFRELIDCYQTLREKIDQHNELLKSTGTKKSKRQLLEDSLKDINKHWREKIGKVQQTLPPWVVFMMYTPLWYVPNERFPIQEMRIILSQAHYFFPRHSPRDHHANSRAWTFSAEVDKPIYSPPIVHKSFFGKKKVYLTGVEMGRDYRPSVRLLGDIYTIGDINGEIPYLNGGHNIHDDIAKFEFLESLRKSQLIEILEDIGLEDMCHIVDSNYTNAGMHVSEPVRAATSEHSQLRQGNRDDDPGQVIQLHARMPKKRLKKVAIIQKEKAKLSLRKSKAIPARVKHNTKEPLDELPPSDEIDDDENSMDSDQFFLHHPSLLSISKKYSGVHHRKKLHTALAIILSSKQYFKKYINGADSLILFIKLASQNLIAQCFVCIERRQPTWLESTWNFIKLATNLPPQYRKKIIEYAFSREEIYNLWFHNRESLDEILAVTPDYEDRLFNLLFSNQLYILNCVCRNVLVTGLFRIGNASLKCFLSFANKHYKYHEKIMESMFQYDAVFKKLFDWPLEFVGNFTTISVEYHDRIIDNIVRLRDEISVLSSFREIYEFTERFPQYLETLVSALLSSEKCVRMHESLKTLTSIYEQNEEHAHRLEGRIIEYPKLVLKIASSVDQFERIHQLGLFPQLLAMALMHMYSDHRLMKNRIISSLSDLERMIRVAPDHKLRLTFCYQLLVEEKNISSLIEENFDNAPHITDIHKHIESSISAGTFDIVDLESAIQRIDDCLKKTSDDTENHLALLSLREYLFKKVSHAEVERLVY